MKEGWTYKTLPDISENLDSIRRPVTKSKRTTGIYPYYGASGIVDYVDDYLFNEDLLCISEDGANLLMRTYPIAFPISGKVWVNNHAHVLRFKSMITQKYVEYYFSGMKLDEYITGAAQPKLTQKALNNIKIYIPSSIDEQQSIVGYLDSAFAKIDSMKANAEKALNEAKALFQASLKEMLEPKEGWEEIKFGKLCDFVRGPFGGSLKKECFKDSGYAVYEQQNAIYNKFSFRYYIDEEKYQSLIRFKVNPGDLIMSCSGTIGKVAIIPEDSKEGVINQALLKLTPHKEIDAHFLKYLMESKYFEEIINANIEGVAIKNIASVAVLKEIKLNIPKVSEQHKIIIEIDSLKSKADRLQENYDKISQECDSLKQAILRQVFE